MSNKGEMPEEKKQFRKACMSVSSVLHNYMYSHFFLYSNCNIYWKFAEYNVASIISTFSHVVMMGAKGRG